MKRCSHRSPLFGLTVLSAGLAVVSGARAQLSFSQSSVFADGIRTAGSAVNTQTFSGPTATFTYSSVNSFFLNNDTTFTDLPLTSLFDGANNAFGVYDYGFLNGDAYFTGAGATAGFGECGACSMWRATIRCGVSNRWVWKQENTRRLRINSQRLR